MRDVPIGFTVSAAFTETGGDLPQLRRDIDAAKGLGATAIRLGADLYRTTPGHLGHLRAGIEYARSLGIRVMLTSSQIAHNGDSTSVATATAVEYVRTVAKAVGHLVTWWQVANEHDARDWRDWSRSLSVVDPTADPAERHAQEVARVLMDEAYLRTLRDVIAACAAEIRAVNPATVVLTATTGVGASSDVEVIWRRFYDVVGPAVDAIGINLYPIMWWEKYAEMPARLRRTARRYGKPVYVTEIGLPSVGSDRPQATVEEEAMEWVAHQVDRASRSTDVAGVFVYQLRDAGTSRADAEQCFGVLHMDGTPKSGIGAPRAMIRSITT